MIGVRSAGGTDWTRLLAPWRLTPAEARLAAALVRAGDLRGAAAAAGVGYETARDTIAAAMAKTGARRQPEFVQRLAALAFGELPAHGATWQTLADAYDLSARQAGLAQLIAVGATRPAAAALLGVSGHTAKADLKLVYERCGVEGAAALGRVVAELDALTRLAAATDVEIVAPGSAPAPLRFVRRRRGPGRIAVEDHGPADGVPVVVFHALTNGRHLPRVLVAACRTRGLRLISIDRAGFGLTSPSGGDVIDDAVADHLDVLDALGLDRVRILGRVVCMPLALAARHPDRFDRGVVLSPNPPGTTELRHGLIGAGIALALDRPRLIDGFARMMVRLSSPSSIMRMSEAAVAGCTSDLAALADPGIARDWIRANRQSSRGDGFAREIRVHSVMTAIPPGTAAARWTTVYGAHDSLATGADLAAAWRTAMPGIGVRVIADGGRFLHLSHPDAVADALAG